MTTIDLDTSPLQAAREWRGIGLVAAAMNCGLPVAQAEALEEGDPEAFGTIDEMIAAAVVYGASIGIGRDEAMALLDRTVTRVGAEVQLPDSTEERPNEAFSGAVHERSARIADRGDAEVAAPLLTTRLTEQEQASNPVLDHLVDEVSVDEPSRPGLAMPPVPHGPSPEQAVTASGELHLDGGFGPDAPWERAGHTGELEAWVDDFDEDSVRDRDLDADRRPSSIATRVGNSSFASLERVVGTDRADAVADWTRTATQRVSAVARDGRERLRRSEHATLFVAIGAGAILIALVVALGGALGGSDEPAGPGPATRDASTPAATDPAATEVAVSETGAPKVVVAKPVIPPARLTLDIYNAGSKKGYAKEVAAQLDAAGYKIGEVSNAKVDYSGATIIHPRDMQREARLLAKRTGISTLQVAPGSTRKITLVVT